MCQDALRVCQDALRVCQEALQVRQDTFNCRGLLVITVFENALAMLFTLLVLEPQGTCF